VHALPCSDRSCGRSWSAPRNPRWTTYAGPGVTRAGRANQRMVGTLFVPPGDGPHPAVMLVSGGWGGLDEYRAALLASHGYAGVQKWLFREPGLPPVLANIPSIFRECHPLMRQQSWLGTRLLAVWGSSRGGELALLLGATFPDINAVSGGCRAACSSGRSGRPARRDVSRQAFALPASKTIRLPEPAGVGGRGKPGLRAIHRSTSRPLAVERSPIAVAAICGPVHCLRRRRSNVASAELADIATAVCNPVDTLTFRHLRFEKADTRFWCRMEPNGACDRVGGYVLQPGRTPRENAEAGSEAWARSAELPRRFSHASCR